MVATDRQEAVAKGGCASSSDMRKLVSESKKAFSNPKIIQAPGPTTPAEIFQAQREQLRREINDNGIKRAPIGSQELPALEGTGSYAWQFYLRGPLLKARHLSFVARCFWSV